MTSVPPEEIAKAGSTLASSKTVRTGLLWVLTAVVLPAAGWGAAKLDTKEDIVALRLSIDRLTTQQIETVSRIDKALPAIHGEIDGVQRDVVVVAGAALAYETSARSKQKLAAGDELAKAYDAERKRGESIASSAKVFRTVAVPHSAR